MVYKEKETRDNSNYYFYEGERMIAKVENNKLTTFENLTEEQIDEIKNVASI